jgi:hypothetical protein
MKSHIFTTTLLVAVASTLSACSSAPGQSDAEQVGSEAASALTESSKSPCPSSAPKSGSTCSDANLLCSWGEDTRFGCRTVEACNSGKWQSVGDSCSAKEPACPARRPESGDAGGALSCTAAELGITCVYDHDAYTCTPCEGNLCFATNRWWQTTLPTACPATEPNFGEACSVAAGTECNYNTCASDGSEDFGAAMTCTKGIWTAYTGTICL